MYNSIKVLGVHHTFLIERLLTFYHKCFKSSVVLFLTTFESQLNLAPQAVLEGLNGIFDHRGEVFVPELCRKFQVDHVKTKIFACQNPQHEGGGRKGLPKSFLNRFTQVCID